MLFAWSWKDKVLEKHDFKERPPITWIPSAAYGGGSGGSDGSGGSGGEMNGGGGGGGSGSDGGGGAGLR